MVLTDESGENKQDTIIPVPAPVKKSTTDFSCFIIPITLSLSIDSTIFESAFNVIIQKTMLKVKQSSHYIAYIVTQRLLFTPVSITPLIDTEDACFDLNASRPIAKGDLKWRDALLVAHRVNSNTQRFFDRCFFLSF